MNIIKYLEKWQYLGYNKYMMDKYHRKLSEENLKILQSMCISIFIINMIVSIFFIYIQESLKALICFIFGIYMIVLKYIVRKILLKKIKCENITIDNILDISSVLSYAVGIFLGIYHGNNNLSVTIIWLFLFVQIIFDRIPTENLLVIPSAVVFLFCSYYTKEHAQFIYDNIHSVAVICIGMVISWSKAKLKIDYIIAEDELNYKNKRLYYFSTIDELTGIFNRKKIFKKLSKLKEECREENCKLYCLVMDIDNFKAFNDMYGHPAGDSLLKAVGKVFKDYCTNKGIYIGRIGGEEFLAVWKESKTDPKIIAEDIRLSVSNLNIPHQGSEAASVVTISQGLFMNYNNDIMNIDPYSIADKALYKAKTEGKNRCCIA